VKIIKSKTDGQFYSAVLSIQSVLILLWVFSNLGASIEVKSILGILVVGCALFGLAFSLPGWLLPSVEVNKPKPKFEAVVPESKHGLSLSRLKEQAAALGISWLETEQIAIRLYEEDYISYPITPSTHMPLAAREAVATTLVEINSVFPGLGVIAALEEPPSDVSTFFVDTFPGAQHAIVPYHSSVRRKSFGKIDAKALQVYQIVVKAYLMAVAYG